VHFLGAVDPARVPSYMRALDVGLLPYRRVEYNRAVSPLKLFEYLAAGLVTVGTGVPTTMKYQRPGVYYYSESDGNRFLTDCEKALEVAENAEWRKARQSFASEHDWSAKFRFMLEVVLMNPTLSSRPV
jgi:teichuronic acid biosynthesis glycosyltransferase TuaH